MLPTCPECSRPLRSQRIYSSVHGRVCPEGDGVLVEDAHLRTLVDEATVQRLRRLIGTSPPGLMACPSCSTAMHVIVVRDVAARGCQACGALWFPGDAIERHVREVRQRQLGRSSFAVRPDVAMLGEDVQPTEVVAGLLAYYGLGSEGSAMSA